MLEAASCSLDVADSCSLLMKLKCWLLLLLGWVGIVGAVLTFPAVVDSIEFRGFDSTIVSRASAHGRSTINPHFSPYLALARCTGHL